MWKERERENEKDMDERVEGGLICSMICISNAICLMLYDSRFVT